MESSELIGRDIAPARAWSSQGWAGRWRGGDDGA